MKTMINTDKKYWEALAKCDREKELADETKYDHSIALLITGHFVFWYLLFLFMVTVIYAAITT